MDNVTRKIWVDKKCTIDWVAVKYHLNVGSLSIDMSADYLSTYWPTPSANLLVDMLAERSTRIRLICRSIWQPRVGRHIGWHVDCVSADSVNQYLARGAQITQDPKSVLFHEKQPWRSETVIKDGFEARNGTWISILNIPCRNSVHLKYTLYRW